jgi:hypothetical protein
MTNRENDEKSQQLLGLMRKAIDQDQQLREKYEVGDKFRFVRERLNALLKMIEQEAQNNILQAHKGFKDLLPGEIPVYVYLYNANGLVLKSWQNMLTPKVFYEYSVNRPIYAEKSAVENFLRFKTNKNQHAFLTMAILPENLLSKPDEHGLVKIKEGSLNVDKMLSFTHNEQEYILSSDGDLVNKG